MMEKQDSERFPNVTRDDVRAAWALAVAREGRLAIGMKLTVTHSGTHTM
jgi:uncharacterized protein (DUF433 family)